MATKFTTGLTGLAVEKAPREKLKMLYGNILKVLSEIPNNATYKQHTEKLTKQQLQIVETTTDLNQLESRLNGGQLEEVIDVAKRELKLARRMVAWKPWEPLLTQPPEGQWTWP